MPKSTQPYSAVVRGRAPSDTAAPSSHATLPSAKPRVRPSMASTASRTAAGPCAAPVASPAPARRVQRHSSTQARAAERDASEAGGGTRARRRRNSGAVKRMAASGSSSATRGEASTGGPAGARGTPSAERRRRPARSRLRATHGRSRAGRLIVHRGGPRLPDGADDHVQTEQGEGSQLVLAGEPGDERIGRPRACGQASPSEGGAPARGPTSDLILVSRRAVASRPRLRHRPDALKAHPG